MQAHQERVVLEREELELKIGKLTAFIGGGVFNSLPEAEQQRLVAQCSHMNEYSRILGERIAAF